jgi:hypothetical protein
MTADLHITAGVLMLGTITADHAAKTIQCTADRVARQLLLSLLLKLVKASIASV